MLQGGRAATKHVGRNGVRPWGERRSPLRDTQDPPGATRSRELVLQRADKNELAISNGLAGKRFIKYLSVLFIGDGSAFAISGQVNRGLISSALATMTAEESWPLLGRAGS